uniref:Uncharacterized protein n=1 Tax=Arundo donax TaxID=35708 RepID=A0A0A8ZHY6_ARUDO
MDANIRDLGDLLRIRLEADSSVRVWDYE